MVDVARLVVACKYFGSGPGPLAPAPVEQCSWNPRSSAIVQHGEGAFSPGVGDCGAVLQGAGRKAPRLSCVGELRVVLGYARPTSLQLR